MRNFLLRIILSLNTTEIFRNIANEVYKIASEIFQSKEINHYNLRHPSLFIVPPVYCTSSLLYCRSQACNFIKKETPVQVFSCEFCEISKNTFFTEHLWATASCHGNLITAHADYPKSVSRMLVLFKNQYISFLMVTYVIEILSFIAFIFVCFWIFTIGFR